jgi:hypothetical protein
MGEFSLLRLRAACLIIRHYPKCFSSRIAINPKVSVRSRSPCLPAVDLITFTTRSSSTAALRSLASVFLDDLSHGLRYGIRATSTNIFTLLHVPAVLRFLAITVLATSSEKLSLRFHKCRIEHTAALMHLYLCQPRRQSRRENVRAPANSIAEVN